MLIFRWNAKTEMAVHNRIVDSHICSRVDHWYSMSIIQSTKKFDASGQNYIVSMSAPDVGTTSIYDGWHNVGPTLGQRWHADVGSNGMPPAKTTLCQHWQLTSVQPSLTLCQRWANVRMLARYWPSSCTCGTQWITFECDTVPGSSGEREKDHLLAKAIRREEKRKERDIECEEIESQWKQSLAELNICWTRDAKT